MAPKRVNITCPYCRAVYRNMVITRHGPIRCSSCGRAMTI